MKTLSILTSIVAAALFTFSGCADKSNPTEGAVNEPAAGSVLGKVTVVHSDGVLPVNFFTDLATGCIEGSLHLTGELHYVTEMVLDDETGMWKLKGYHDNWEKVTAVTESGVVYKVIRVRNYPRVTGGRLGSHLRRCSSFNWPSRGNWGPSQDTQSFDVHTERRRFSGIL